SPADLGSETIAVARGTTQDLELTAAAPDANIQRFDDDATAAAAFLSGQVQLLATANVVAKDLIDKNPGVVLKPKFILRYSPTHIGIQQGNPELLRWLDTCVFYHLTTGKLSEITEKWLWQPLPATLPSPRSAPRRTGAGRPSIPCVSSPKAPHGPQFDSIHRPGFRQARQADRLHQYPALAARGRLGCYAHTALRHQEWRGPDRNSHGRQSWRRV